MKRKAKTLRTGRKPNGYWQLKENRVNTLKEVMAEHDLNRMPLQRELADWGYTGLLDTINDYDGGLVILTGQMGIKTRERKPNGYWHNQENLIREAEEAIKVEEWKVLPGQEKLFRAGYASLAVSISKNVEGGYPGFRELLGEEVNRTKHGAWKDFDFASREVMRIKRKHGWKTLPCYKTLCEFGYSGLGNAISGYHGGYEKFRVRLGEDLGHTPQNSWKSRNFLLKELRKLMRDKNLNRLPSNRQLNDMGYARIALAISRYHGGFREFRQSFGEKPMRLTPNAWKELEFTIERAKNFMIENGFSTLPSHQKIIKYNGGPSLSRAIIKYHGGYVNFRLSLGQYNLVKSEEQFKEELSRDNKLSMLSGAAIMLNGEGANIEEMMIQIYPSRFRSRQQLHDYIMQSRAEILQVLNNGLTNLGTYIGEFSLFERSIIPVLIGNGLSGIDENRISDNLQQRIIRSLHSVYSPIFNSNPQEVMKELEEKVEMTIGTEQNIYSGLRQHYQEIIRLQGELK